MTKLKNLENSFNIWDFLTSLEDEKNVARCKKCGKKLKCGGGSTSGLNRHLQGQHGIDKNNFQEYLPKLDRENTLHPFILQKHSVPQQIMTKLIVLDRIPLNTIVRSTSLRFLFEQLSFNLPNSSTTLNSSITKQALNLKMFYKDEIMLLINKGKKFSISFDEYTGINTIKYLNLNLHLDSEKFWILGIINIHGSGTAEKLCTIIKNRLNEYNLIIEKHIVACVSDGASVCKKVVNLLNVEHHICYLHSLHLGIIESLYLNRTIYQPVGNDSNEESSNNLVDEDTSSGSEDGLNSTQVETLYIEN